MSFQQFNGYGGQARRDDGKVQIYLMSKQPVPDMVPYELRDHVNPDDWHMRLTAVRDLSARFHHPLFERIWFFVATIVTIVLPVLLYSIIVNTLTKGLNVHTDRQQVEEDVFKAKAISSAVFIGIILVFWAPMLVWKMIGKRRLRNLCAGWYKADSASRAPGTFVPVWSADLPGLLRNSALVCITMPPNARPTVFHPDAYMPPYINPPADAGAPYYYPYNAGQGMNGLPRMSVAGTLPAYQREQGKERYFEDVKV